MTQEISLGDIVQDRITGFKGTAVGLHHYLFGCTRVSVQPLADKTSFKEAVSFDMPSLVLLKKRKVKGDNTTGGPAKYNDARRY